MIYKNIIGYLMYRANCENNGQYWYPLKTKLCTRFGICDGHDVQFIEGKTCNVCNGSGLFRKYSFGSCYNEQCYKCYHGWYKTPSYVLLQRIRVGKYVFHQPIKRVESIKNITDTELPASVTIYGYIRHEKKPYGWLAFTLLNIIYYRKGYKQYVQELGVGWAMSWWLPKNWLKCAMHFKQYRWEAIPLRDWRLRWKRRLRVFRKHSPDELPF